MHHRTPSIQSDVAIVGAGPAGLACAIASARHGLKVDVIDAMQPSIDKACGEGLIPDSIAALSALGFDRNEDFCPFETHQLRGIRFFGAPATVPTIVQAVFPGTPGLGIRRTVLHQLLLQRAIHLGVRFHWQNSVQGISTTSTGTLIQTNRQSLTARYLVGADGHHSRIAAWAGLTQSRLHSRRIGLRQHYTLAPWSDFIEVYWSDHGQAYITPISPTEICVAFLSNHKHPTPAAALQHFPELQRRLAPALPSDTPRGAITLGRTLHRVTSGNIALIGDASGSVDAITGEGLSLCFRQAAALSLALKTDNLAAYQQAHRRIQRLPTLMSRTLLLMDRHPRLRTVALTTFQRHPRLFERLLQIHIGHTPIPLFDPTHLLAT
ncbi:NAD(P)/FAD-dependent oxidoreductase [Granulicella sp. L60]|uniref:NAD(P)/FAD-dependent oxidoreductase n=1 Tax=Granulicella sp. L60 TaxID=1641866 RepID=UPI00131C158D|nr:NAD(P)/FAD-dependent oxidoreductase [Granulicella sp. L60]